MVYEWYNVFNLGLDQYNHSNFENQYLEFLKIVQNLTVNINLYSFQVFENNDFTQAMTLSWGTMLFSGSK